MRIDMTNKISKIKAEDYNGWETVIDFTEIDKNGVSAKEVVQALRRIEE